MRRFLYNSVRKSSSICNISDVSRIQAKKSGGIITSRWLSLPTSSTRGTGLRLFNNTTIRCNSTSVGTDDGDTDVAGISNMDDATLNQYDRKVTEGRKQGLFRYHLGMWYRSMYDLSLKDAFETWQESTVEKDRPRHFWTAAFTCPLTGEVIEPRSETSTISIQHKVDDRCFYSNKKQAVQAVCLEVLLRYEIPFDEQGPSPEVTEALQELEEYYQKNHDVSILDAAWVRNDATAVAGTVLWTASIVCPVTKQAFNAVGNASGELALQDSNDVSWYKTKQSAIRAAASSVMESRPPPPGQSSGPMDSPNISTQSGSSLSLTLSYHPLAYFYKEKHGLKISKNDFVTTSTTSDNPDEGLFWNASFICPANGTRYDSYSSLNDPDAPIGHDSKDEAILVAALKAFNSQHDSFSSENEDLRYQNPGSADTDLSDIATSEQHADEQTDAIPSAKSPFSTATSHSGVDGPIDSTKQLERRTSSSDLPATEYSIEVVPSIIDSFQPGTPTKSTLELIADTWLETPSGSSAGKNGVEELVDFKERRQGAIQRAYEWLENNNRAYTNSTTASTRLEFDVKVPVQDRKIATLILQSLASSHRNLPFQSEPCGVEEAATAILEHLWKMSGTAAPDADVYASYIQCLEGDDPSRLAKRARKIYSAMRSGSSYEGRTLPPPNGAVQNSVIQLLSEAGIKTHPGDVRRDLEPNRDTVMAMLSYLASSQDKELFDEEYARRCTEFLSELDSDRTDAEGAEGRHPSDLMEVLGAALRWSGPKEFSTSGIYARCIDWDAYKEKYFEEDARRQSEPEDGFSYKQADAIARWVESVAPLGSANPIEPATMKLYESLIQAWVRTGTVNGIEKAESYIERILDLNPNHLPVYVIHPILAAWSFSGTMEGISKVDDWLEKRLHGTMPHAMSDTRIRATPVIARISYIAREIERVTTDDEQKLPYGNAPERLATLKKVIDECTDIVNKLCQESIDDDTLKVDADSFALAIRAWHLLISHPSFRESEHLVEAYTSIMKLMKSYEGMISHWGNKSETTIPRQHLFHFIQGAPMVYGSGLLACNEIREIAQRAADDDRGSRSTLYALPLTETVEEIASRAAELLVFLGMQQPRMSSKNIRWDIGTRKRHQTYPDMFVYEYESLLASGLPTSIADLFLALLNTLANTTVDGHGNFDKLRISSILLESYMRHKKTDFATKDEAYRVYHELINKVNNTKKFVNDPFFKQLVRDLEKSIQVKGIQKEH